MKDNDENQDGKKDVEKLHMEMRKKYFKSVHLAVPAEQPEPEILDFEKAYIDQLTRQMFGKRSKKALEKRREILAATQADTSPVNTATNGKHFIYSLLEAIESDKGSYIVLSSIGDENPQIALKAYRENSLVDLKELFEEFCDILAKRKKGSDDKPRD